ncbi:MAG: RNA methyltransferase [Bacteroidia bacterium]|nr:RNA methyltransferase [Bacteroidia bacterium]NNF83210.1 RNA methyltransferase [Flavobacteriaceae bacterium]NNL80303.1 RNA methyltransferase [Flavobacteriaceae bacterium]
MLSKSQLKLINSLKHKKYRSSHKLFIAEGRKSILELIKSGVSLVHLYTTTLEIVVPDDKRNTITSKEMNKISAMKTPPDALALFKIPEPVPIDHSGLIVALDAVNDPGNLGTIIRLCDWFGVRDLVCSSDTVDCYNPKVVQATMGSIARVNITYTSLDSFIKNSGMESYGAVMNGANIYSTDLPSSGILVFGSESHGISEELNSKLGKKLTIPRFGDDQQTESLNVANAVAIFLSEFRRALTGK